jgi:hypothetical protein
LVEEVLRRSNRLVAELQALPGRLA